MKNCGQDKQQGKQGKLSNYLVPTGISQPLSNNQPSQSESGLRPPTNAFYQAPTNLPFSNYHNNPVSYLPTTINFPFNTMQLYSTDVQNGSQNSASNSMHPPLPFKPLGNYPDHMYSPPFLPSVTYSSFQSGSSQTLSQLSSESPYQSGSEQPSESPHQSDSQQPSESLHSSGLLDSSGSQQSSGSLPDAVPNLSAHANTSHSTSHFSCSSQVFQLAPPS